MAYYNDANNTDFHTASFVEGEYLYVFLTQTSATEWATTKTLPL